MHVASNRFDANPATSWTPYVQAADAWKRSQSLPLRNLFRVDAGVQA